MCFLSGCGPALVLGRHTVRWTSNYRDSKRFDRRLNVVEAGKVGFEGAAIENEVGAASVTDDFNEPGGFELFEVVGHGGGADGVMPEELGTGSGVFGGADLFEDLVAAGLCEGAGDPGELAMGEAGGFGGGHVCQGRTRGGEKSR